MRNVLILEDHPDMREWLVTIVDEALQGCQIFQAGTLAEARELSVQSFDMALVDLNLPDGSGVDFIQWLLNKQPNCYIVVATIFDDDEHLFRALQVGALGYLLKEDHKDSLIAALKGVLDGQPPLSAAIARKIIKRFQTTGQSLQPQPVQSCAPIDSATLVKKLTEREEQVLNLVAKGFNRKEVADYLSITVNTAASHVKNIYRKLNVGSRAEVALEAQRLGLT